MTQAAFTEALLLARSQGPDALSALAEEHLPLVKMLAARLPWTGYPREELVQQGVLGLMKALQRYDPSRGTTFSTYAAALILGEMRMLRREDAPLHIPRTDREKRSRLREAQQQLTSVLAREPTIDELATALHMDAAELVLQMEDVTVTSMDAPITEDGAPLSELLPEQDDWLSRLMLRDIFARLSPDDRQLLVLRYQYGFTQAEAAQRLGTTQSQVSRREKVLRTLLHHAWNDD